MTDINSALNKHVKLLMSKIIPCFLGKKKVESACQQYLYHINKDYFQIAMQQFCNTRKWAIYIYIYFRILMTRLLH